VGVTVTGVDGVVAMLEAAKGRLRDLGPVLSVVAADTVTLIDDSFAGGHTPENVAWAPLSPKTLARRRGGSGNPLVDTSRMRSSTTAYGRGTTLSFGSNVPYAPPQQWGATRSGTLKNRSYSPRREAGSPFTVTIPARPFLPVRKVGGGYALMTVGAAGEHWARMRRMVTEYIVSGRVT
jgi:phage gpG-like protein